MTGALLFDLDGTLIDTDPLHARVFIDMFAEMGRALTVSEYMQNMHGRLNQDIFADYMPGCDADAMSDEKEARFRRVLGASVPPTRGLLDLLGWAREHGIPVALVTNAPAENAEVMLAATGLGAHFTHRVIGSECAAGKPDPAPYLRALEVLRADASRSLAFEDSPSGVKSASGAGVFCIGMRSSLDEAALIAAGADATIEDFSDPTLPAHLARLKGIPA